LLPVVNFTKQNYFHHRQRGKISWSVCPWQVVPALSNTTFQVLLLRARLFLLYPHMFEYPEKVAPENALAYFASSSVTKKKHVL
jgi:hypothetical protein